MYLAIEFTDGSNPWVKFRLKDKTDIEREVKKWERGGYFLYPIIEDDSGTICKATYYVKR